jgi:hypothetical protein
MRVAGRGRGLVLSADFVDILSKQSAIESQRDWNRSSTIADVFAKRSQNPTAHGTVLLRIAILNA